MTTWYEELDFEENPFTIKPRESLEEFIGNKPIVKKIKQAIEDEKCMVLRGKYGTGKTSVVKSIINEHKGEGKVFYYNAYASDKELDYEDVIKRAGNALARFFRTKTKNIIMIIDEAHHMSKENLEAVEDYIASEHFRSVVFVTSDLNYEFPKAIKKLVSFDDTIQMFSEFDAIKIVKNRLEDEYQLLPNDIIKELYRNSDTPRDFLRRCEDACRNAVRRGNSIVNKKDLQ